MAKDGTVLYDSVADPATMENHADRAEIRQAEQEGSGQSKHLSDTLLQKTLYYAVRLDDGTVLRLASVQTTMGVILLGVLQPVLLILVLAVLISALLASRLARQITKPINSIDLEDPRRPTRPMESSSPWSAACGSRTAPSTSRWRPCSAASGSLRPWPRT